MKQNKQEIEIIKLFKKLLKNKPKGHHDPIFLGNERKYLNKCISSGYVSYVGKFVSLFEKKIYLNIQTLNMQSPHLLVPQLYI